MGRAGQWLAARVVSVYHFGLQVLLLGLILLFFLQEVLSSIRRRVWRPKVDRNRVVIIGGGFSGSQVARQLEGDFDVTIIDTKRFFEFTPSALRALVEPHHARVIQRAHLHYLRSANFVHDQVVSLNQSAVVTSANGSISYDYLVICTGASYAALPGKTNNECLLLSARVHNLGSHFNSLSRARQVLIIGAGTVGVELAAEIIERFPGKEVHLVGPILARSTSKSARYASEWLSSRGVNLMPGDKVLRGEGRHFYLSSGRTLEADIAFVCTGNVPNSSFMTKSPVFASSLTPSGFARATQNLLLEGFNNVFVAGDMTYIPGEEEKLCQDALECASVISDNITRLARNPSAKLATYEPCKRPMIISLGKYDGMFTYRGWTVCGFICALMKDFVEWKEMVGYQGSFWPGAPRYTPALHLHAV